MGASFAIATGGVLILFIAAPPNGSSVWVRVVDEVAGAVFERDHRRPARRDASPVAAAVHEHRRDRCRRRLRLRGVYLETDF
jgi:hypothetical protein